MSILNHNRGEDWGVSKRGTSHGGLEGLLAGLIARPSSGHVTQDKEDEDNAKEKYGVD